MRVATRRAALAAAAVLAATVWVAFPDDSFREGEGFELAGRSFAYCGPAPSDYRALVVGLGALGALLLFGSARAAATRTRATAAVIFVPLVSGVVHQVRSRTGYLHAYEACTAASKASRANSDYTADRSNRS